MPQRYLHFINQEGLHCHLVRQHDVQHLHSFAGGEEGVQGFEDWLQETRDGLHTLLADVADEGFHLENIPHVVGPDRRALITRKLTQHFFGSPYSAALSLGRDKNGRRDERLLFTAITRPALVEPWLAALRRAEAAVTALYSVPLLTEKLVRRVFPDSPRGLILLLSDSGIRQIYFEQGKLRFSRLAQAPEGPFSRWGLDCLREAQKTYQYLNAQRWLPRGTALPVRIVLSARDAEPLLAELAGTTQPVDNLQFQAASLEALAHKLRIPLRHRHSDSREVIMQLAMRETTSVQLAPPQERRFYRIWQARFAILVAGVVVLAASSVLSLKWALDTRTERAEAESQRSQTMLQDARYKQLLTSLPQMPTSLDALRSTVDGIEQLSVRVVDPRMALQHLSKTLDAFPDITLDGLEWQEADWRDDARNTPSSSAPMTRQTLIASASLDAASASDPRATISRIQAFANALRQQSRGDVVLVQQPFDTESDKTLRSEAQNAGKRPAFRLQLTLPGAKP
ncbi:hypothetical protein VVD49_14865 [Uliginosibacterium sp. H3]|uniref:Uncharacterized protein n=1 Tax=Uliginosibacterium silvisoli TaxID=3114758 RepID=A0ABU6K5T8_9RHOO|nr:hypothetical protein [Uliginosibacterium sp. H3]